MTESNESIGNEVDRLDNMGQFSGTQIDKLTKSVPSTLKKGTPSLEQVISPEQLAFNREHNIPDSWKPAGVPDPIARRSERSPRYVPPRRR